LLFTITNTSLIDAHNYQNIIAIVAHEISDKL